MGIFFKSTAVLLLLVVILLALVLVLPTWFRSLMHSLVDAYAAASEAFWKNRQRKVQTDILEEERINQQVWSPPKRSLPPRMDVDVH